MSKRLFFRRDNGQFRRGSLEDLGIRTAICACGAVNPYTRREVTPGAFPDPAEFNQWDRPTTCSQCGKELPEE